VADFRETPGCGIEGIVAGNLILLGSPAWVSGGTGGPAVPVVHPPAGMARAGGATRPSRSAGGVVSASSGESPMPPAIGSSVSVAINGALRGGFRLENSLRPEVEKLIASLGGRYELALLSGDNEREAARFEKIFGGDAILKFNQTPADKLRFIRELQQRGCKVMMVGDGLNDAGALKQAEVGVAVVEQVGAFSPASDVILDAAELTRLAAVLQFSRSAVRIVRTGFVISAIYNLIGVGFAAAGLLQPMVCAILMPISSASVVFFACSATTWQARRMGLMTASPSGNRSAAFTPLQPTTANCVPQNAGEAFISKFKRPEGRAPNAMRTP
jgi:P-type Cu+ transporter